MQDVLDAIVVALWLVLGRLKAQLFDLLDDVAKGQTVGAPGLCDYVRERIGRHLDMHDALQPLHVLRYDGRVERG